MKRGFFGIGIYHPQHDCNVGTLFRSALAFGASYTFTIGRKYRKRAPDTCNSPRHIPIYNYLTFEEFKNHLPLNSRIVCVETFAERSLDGFCHPEQAAYLLGNEVTGIPEEFAEQYLSVKIETNLCLNVASCGSIVMYDRAAKARKLKAHEPTI